ncbi:MAG: DUF4350 domain-containing protein [Cyanobacteria bacterium RM1_2_2]|nr:DUF4350 domain-containing protein [Cyanobacteria bacterium RM1_2_2]
MRLKRWIGAGILALLVIVLLSVLIAPQSQQRQGSTYSRAPSGYGAWYAYMKQQDLPIQRWQRPLTELFGQENTPPVKEIASPTDAQSPLGSPITLMQINGRSVWFGAANEDWVKRGNVLILVGVRTPVSEAPFRARLASSVGAIKIETSRREPVRQSITPRLQDQYGAVVWETVRGQGKMIYVATPHFAANAYQDEPGNFEFLAQLATAAGHPIYIDEYLHGYRDTEDQAGIGTETPESLAGYLAKTPLRLVAIQVGVILVVLIWGQNQRLGLPRPVPDAAVDNSKAYIQALAAVLQKAGCSEFVMETIGKAEQQQAQQALGLGATLLEPQTVVDAWVQQTGRPAAEMQEVLQYHLAQRPSRRLSNAAMRVWLNKLQNVRRQLE